ncbi:hypothetical protein EVG20_g2729 [Dentipellis fragilis]|uniref:Small ribosomal subunit protein uS17 n=1 Tax=Dentipellis fragilis TaxID=205917 RepID=A0A4Y9Z8X1_9AGAM|nr:hypothetical protein EVG20_g2729 [Dentipellis fragilis]
MADQIEKAFQKQPLFQNAKARVGKKVSTKEKRWYKDVGLGFKTPQEAINGTYIDKKCPFTSDVSIRGRILTGRVISNKMNRTIVIRRDYLHYVPKYNRYEKRHKNLAAHASPAFRVEVGDTVTVVPAPVKNRSLQRAPGVEEQGCEQGLRQVLGRGGEYDLRLHSVSFHVASPQPGSPSSSAQALPMGQQPSKKSRRSGRDKDKDSATDSANHDPSSEHTDPSHWTAKRENSGCGAIGCHATPSATLSSGVC